MRVYKLFTGIEVNPTDVGAQAAMVWGEITIAGLTLAFILFIAAIWFYIRTIIVEHEGFHRLAEEAHKHGALEEARGNSRWERVVALASTGEENNWRLAIMDADSMLEELLDSQGYPGETMGDKLKSANPLQFTTLDLAWQAHKVRNAVAHLGQAYPLSERETRATIDFYARVFEEFGII